MASFVRVENGIVVQGVKVDDSEAPNEAAGAAFLADLIGGEWVQTFYPIGQPDPYPRGKYAAIGDLWDGANFTTPQSESITETV